MNKSLVVIVVAVLGAALVWFLLGQDAVAPHSDVMQSEEESIAVSDSERSDDEDSASESMSSVDQEDGARTESEVIEVETFQYGYSPDPLVLPAGEIVTLRFSSRDVAHSFTMFAEGFEDLNVAIPANGETVDVEFQVPDVPGEYDVACEIFCGSGHSHMHGSVRVE